MREIIFEFIGGSWDGMNLSNASADPIEASLAVHTFRLTRSGRRGAVVRDAFRLRRTPRARGASSMLSPIGRSWPTRS